MSRRTTDYLVVHGAWTEKGHDADVDEIREWHLDRGFRDVGYHYVIRRDGRVQEGRTLEAMGAHLKGYNNQSVGICLVGGKPDNLSPLIPDYEEWYFNYTWQQMGALQMLLEQIQKMYPDARIRGHNDFPGVQKDCPGFDVPAWWNGGRVI